VYINCYSNTCFDFIWTWQTGIVCCIY